MTCCRFPPLPSPIPNHKKTNKENQENMKTSPLLLAAVAVAVVAPIASGRAPLSDRTSRGNLGPTPSRRLAKGPQSSSPLASASVFPPRSRGRVLSTPTAPRNLGSKTGKSSKNGKHGKSSKSSQSSSAHHYVAPHGMNLDGVNTKSGKSSKSAKAPGGSKSKSGKVGKSASHKVAVLPNPPTPQPVGANLEEAWVKIFNVDDEINLCTGAPCVVNARESFCRSQFGTCGSGRMYCNSASTWTITCPSPTATPTRGPISTIEPTFNVKTSQAFATPEPTYDIQLTQSAPMFEEDFLGIFHDLTDPNEATEEDNTRRMPPPSVKGIELDSPSGLPIGAWIGIAVAVPVAFAALAWVHKLSMQNQLGSPVDETGGMDEDITDDLI